MDIMDTNDIQFFIYKVGCCHKVYQSILDIEENPESKEAFSCMLSNTLAIEMYDIRKFYPDNFSSFVRSIWNILGNENFNIEDTEELYNKYLKGTYYS